MIDQRSSARTLPATSGRAGCVHARRRAVQPRHRRRHRPRPPALASATCCAAPRALPGQARRRGRRPPDHLRRVRRRGEPGRARAGRPRPGQGRPARAAVAQLLAVRGARVRHREARRRAGAGQLHARRRRDRLHPRALRRERRWSSRTRWRPTAEKALAAAGVDGGVRGWIGLSGAAPADGWEDVDDWWTDGPDARPGRRRRRRRPAAADVHLGHRVAAQGRDAVQPLADRPVRQLRDRRRDERRRRRGALAADVPLRAAGLLLLGVDVYLGATSIILPGPDPARAAGDDRARAGHQAVLPADGVDLAAAPPRLRHHRPVQPAQGLLRRLADAGGGAARAAAPAARRRAVELLRPDRDGPAGHDPAPARAAAAGRLGRPGRRSTSRPGWSTTTDEPVAAGRGRRDRAPQPARRARLLRRRGEDRRGVPRRLVPLRRPRRPRPRTATSPSSTARRT